MPTSILGGQSPFQKLFGRLPNYTKLRPFGCLCFPWLRPYVRTKLDPKSVACVFLGYSLGQSAYKCLDPTTGRIYLSRHVRFQDTVFPYRDMSMPQPQFTTPCDSSKPIFIPIPSNLPTPLPLPVPQDTPPHDAPPQDVPDQPVPTDVSVSVPPQDVHDQPVPTDVSVSVPVPADGSVSGSVSANESVSIPVSSVPSSSTAPAVSSRPKWVRKPNPRYFNDKFVNFATTHPMPESIEPRSVSQALCDVRWKQAMVDEFEALLRNETWELVPRSSHATVGSKWVFRVKRKPDGSIDRFKARLVAKFFYSSQGVIILKLLVP